MIQNPKLQRICRRQHFAGKQNFFCLVHANAFRKTLCTIEARNNTEGYLRKTEFRLAAGKADIRAKDELKASSKSIAIHSCNGWLIHQLNLTEYGRSLSGIANCLQRRVSVHLLNVRTSNKRLALSGKDDHTNLIICDHIVYYSVKICQHLTIERIQRFRTVKCDGCDPVFFLQ